jgi:glucose/arabinose dehydrogenase
MNGLLISLLFISTVYSKTTFESEGQKLKLEVVYDFDEILWGFDFVGSDYALVTLKSGDIKKINLKNKKVITIEGAPKSQILGQGGLLDIRVLEGVKTSLYITYAKSAGRRQARTALAQGELKNNKIVNLKDLLITNTTSSDGRHFGSRLDFKGDKLFMTVGDRGDRDKAQDLRYHHGSVLRLNLDGSVPSDNPFFNKKNVKKEIYSFGHRNPQGLAIRSDGIIFEAEFGPRGGDEINIIQSSLNYGWPIITYGREYYGPKIGQKKKKGMEQPLHYWVPSISPSAIDFYEHDKIKKWKGNLFVAALGNTHVRRLILNDTNQVIKEEELFKNLGERIRNIRQHPNGDLYFSTDSGKLFRINL